MNLIQPLNCYNSVRNDAQPRPAINKLPQGSMSRSPGIDSLVLSYNADPPFAANDRCIQNFSFN